MSENVAPLAPYEFGKNWEAFVGSGLDQARVTQAREHVLSFLQLGDLSGRVFLDIGCGSGIHSLGALQAGAAQVVSFDRDPDSVRATRRLWTLAGSPENWTVLEGSVLDPAFLATLPQADVVYSWGVLHHTGSMWEALTGAATKLAADGVFYIALYCADMYVDPPASYWMDIKRRYCGAGPVERRWMELSYAWKHTIWPALKIHQIPFEVFSARPRGMKYWTDVRDWLGGWPMEFASIAETKDRCLKDLGLELLHISAGEANTEYLFRKKNASNYWDFITAKRQPLPLIGPFEQAGRFGWSIALDDALVASCDTPATPKRSRVMLYEDGCPIGFSHQPHAHVMDFGKGRYSHWDKRLLFSTTDNSNPNTNSRAYTICPDGL